jgi:hypothetical protein
MKDYGDFSIRAAELSLDEFYDTMDDILSPAPRSADRVLSDLVRALHEQVNARVRSVENGRTYLDKATGTIPMPEDAEIFETKGAWEDFSTPARDLRLLIAIDVVAQFPARVLRMWQRFGLANAEAGRTAATELTARMNTLLKEASVSYTRSDGSAMKLTLDEVVARRESYEMAYNPNDCPELRWGAAADSDEAKTCRKRAPQEQKQRMQLVRKWFQERRRPARK